MHEKRAFLHNAHAIGVGNEAFIGCSNLQELTIADSVKDLTLNVIGCTNLTKITAPVSTQFCSLPYYDYSGNSPVINDLVLTSGDSSKKTIDSYELPTFVKNIIIPECITTLTANAFNGSTTLKTVTISRSVKRIEAQAFDGCSSLTQVTFKNAYFWKTEYGISVNLSDSYENARKLKSGHFSALICS